MLCSPYSSSRWRPVRASPPGPAMTTEPKPPLAPRARRRRVRLAIIVLSVGAGLLCGYLPEEYQAMCKLAAKVVAFFGGG